MTDLWLFLESSITASLSSPVLLFFVIVLSTFILEDPTTLAVGYLLAQAQITLPLALSSLVVGIFLGDFGLYLLGVGVRRGFFKHRRFDQQPTSFDLFLGRFIPGLRTLTFGAAGFFGFSPLRFLVIGFVTSLLWTVLLLTSSSWIIEKLNFLPKWMWPLIGVGLIVGVHLIKARVSGKRARPVEKI